MRLRIAELLANRKMTAYGLAKASNGRLSLSAAARLARDEWKCLPRDVVEVLCEVLNVQPGELFEQVVGEKKRRRG
jgi:DNA-binding Xre family transcriptional regulator